MTTPPRGVVRSPLDEARFGIRAARVEWMTAELLPEVLEFCRREKVQLLMANCRSPERRTIQAMEREGFRLMDTIVSWEIDLTKPLPPRGDIPIRLVRPGEEEVVASLAAEAFRGYLSHYHADPHLDAERCAEAYPDWVRRCCVNRDATNDVMVAEIDDRIVSFVLMKMLPSGDAVYPLAGVSPTMRRNSVIHFLAVGVLEWGRDHGARRGYAQIQLDNVPMQRAMLQLGFQPSEAWSTFHKWFDRP